MLLEGYRALDLTDAKGTYCGKMLAELGVEVIKVEPPEGSVSERSIGPFYHDELDSERSLYWFAYNTNKRGITLNLNTADGRELFQRLAAGADIVIESFQPGYLDGLGLGYAALADMNPAVILTSITPFGQTGPRANYAACDLTILALGGLMNLNGDRDRAPLRFAVEQSFTQAGAQAAAATTIALHHRIATGRGQHVDVSMQEAISEVLFLQQHYWDVAGIIQHRQGTSADRINVILEGIFPCQDGYVSWRITVAGQGRQTQALIDWMAAEGMAGELNGVDATKLNLDDFDQAQVDRWEALFAAFFRTKTRAELHGEAVRRGIMLYPMSFADDLLADKHLAARDFWLSVPHPELGATLRYPGPPYRSSAVQRQTPRRAPTLGEDNIAVYCDELGLTRAELCMLAEAGAV